MSQDSRKVTILPLAGPDEMAVSAGFKSHADLEKSEEERARQRLDGTHSAVARAAFLLEDAGNYDKASGLIADPTSSTSNQEASALLRTREALHLELGYSATHSRAE